MDLCDQRLRRIVDGLGDENDLQRIVLDPDAAMTREEQAIIGEIPLTKEGDPQEVVCKSARLH